MNKENISSLIFSYEKNLKIMTIQKSKKKNEEKNLIQLIKYK